MYPFPQKVPGHRKLMPFTSEELLDLIGNFPLMPPKGKRFYFVRPMLKFQISSYLFYRKACGAARLTKQFYRSCRAGHGEVLLAEQRIGTRIAWAQLIDSS